MKKNPWKTMLLLLGIVFVMTGCAGGKAEDKAVTANSKSDQESGSGAVLGGNIGISFPSENDSVGREDAQELQEKLEENGYQVEVGYAGEDSQKQVEQLEKMIEDKKNCLIIDAVNPSSLTEVLEKAGKQGIAVISYRSLIAASKDVSYYVGFDYEEIGKSVGGYLVDAKKLDSARKNKERYTIEFFMGDVGDYNSQLEFTGIMSVLEPYFEEGILECNSLRTAYEDVTVAKSSAEIAKVTSDNIMQANYMDKPVDIVCSVDDDMAGTIVSSLEEQAGFKDDWPCVTGCTGTEEAFQRIKDGTQNMTVYTDDSTLPQLCAKLVNQVIQGEDLGDMKTVNNGEIDIPAIIGSTQLAYKDNYQEVMKKAGIAE